MILRKRDKEHAEAIIKHCTDNGMSVESTMGLWNHLVRLFKRMELLEGRAAKTGGAVDKQPTTGKGTPCQPVEFHKACRIAGVAVCPKCGATV